MTATIAQRLAEARHNLRMAECTRCDACDGYDGCSCECDSLDKWLEDAKAEIIRLEALVSACGQA